MTEPHGPSAPKGNPSSDGRADTGTSPAPIAGGVALVTGSGSGIGAATARRLAAAGMTVAVHSRSSASAGTALAEELGGSYFQADLEDDSAAADLVPRVLDRYGRLDVLVNNAGISWPVPHAELAALTPVDRRRILDVNLIAPWVLCTAAPGLVDTPLTADWTEAHQLWRTTSPLRRAAHPEDVANFIHAILTTPYLTGEVILLDGGLNLR